MATLIYRKGLDFKHEVAAELDASYRSALVDTLKAGDYCHRSGRLTIHLAREFGFCYGVDRAVDYAYQARRRFPDRPIWLTGEIIHNPHVNEKLRAQGIRFLTDEGVDVDRLSADDVVILPAFGVTIEQLVQLERKGCTLVDTTCGSVLNVWKNVRRYAQDGFTSIIHGKYKHEETRATGRADAQDLVLELGLAPAGAIVVEQPVLDLDVLRPRIVREDAGMGDRIARAVEGVVVMVAVRIHRLAADHGARRLDVARRHARNATAGPSVASSTSASPICATKSKGSPSSATSNGRRARAASPDSSKAIPSKRCASIADGDSAEIGSSAVIALERSPLAIDARALMHVSA